MVINMPEYNNLNRKVGVISFLAILPDAGRIYQPTITLRLSISRKYFSFYQTVNFYNLPDTDTFYILWLHREN